MIQDKFKAALWFVDKLGQHPRRLFLISAGILISGFLCHFLAYPTNPDTLAFPRSGAILVIFAIIAVFFNHVLGTIKSGKEQHVEKFDKPEGLIAKNLEIQFPKLVAEKSGQKIVDNTLANDPEFFKRSANDIARQMKEAAEEAKSEIEILKTAQVNIAYTEAGAGITGTFIWAFGDIIFKLIYRILFI